jgi:hypothetical protein
MNSKINRATHRTALFVLLCALPAASQSSSSTLSEITESIKTNLSGNACLSFTMGRSQRELEHYVEGTEAIFSECEMRLVTSLSDNNSGTIGDYKVHLGKLDPARIAMIDGVQVPSGWLMSGTSPQAGIRLITAADEKVIEAVGESFGAGESKPTSYKTSEITIRMRDKESAAKLAEAFSRAVALCGGKPVVR